VVDSAQNTARLQEAVKAKGVPLYVICAEIRALTQGKCKLDPGDLGRIVKGVLIPNVGQRLGISAALGKSVEYLFPKEDA